MKSITFSLLAVAAMLGSITTASADSGVPKDYPLKKCPVSDEALGEHGKPVKVTYEGTDVWLCCKSCIKDFKKEPAKFTKMVKDAQRKK
jgi:YHS domain-containing protein